VNVALLAQTACTWEATARKAGNVHPGAFFANLEYTHFLLSSAAIGRAFMRLPSGVLVGGLILDAVSATQRTVGTNTNLGMLLLLAPLALVPEKRDLRSGVAWKLSRLKVTDAELVYKAIRLASPGGLGDSPEQDVREEPTVTLLEAMRLAADRDLIARQYANGFADVLDFGVPAFLGAFERFGCVEAAIIESQLQWMANYPDSLIARKNGLAVAEDVQRRAAEVQRLGGIATPEGRRAGVALDKHLRSDGNKLNPGTTADLIAACLFVALRENKVAPSAPFRWDVPDWL
jgi:triphosphoribosyl-dephospho-CoA synthase